MSCRAMGALIMTPFMLIWGVYGLFIWGHLTEGGKGSVVACLVFSAWNILLIVLWARKQQADPMMTARHKLDTVDQAARSIVPEHVLAPRIERNLEGFGSALARAVQELKSDATRKEDAEVIAALLATNDQMAAEYEAIWGIDDPTIRYMRMANLNMELVRLQDEVKELMTARVDIDRLRSLRERLEKGEQDSV